jgi:hypothetical protein
VRLHVLCVIYFIFDFSLLYVSDSRLRALVNMYVFDLFEACYGHYATCDGFVVSVSSKL